MRLRIAMAVAAGMLVAAAAVPVHAGITLELNSVTPSVTNPGAFLWTYQASITAGDRLNSGGTVPAPGINPEDDEVPGANSIKDYVTVFDFGGFTGNVVLPGGGFAFVSYPLGSTPADQIPEESAGFPNITIYYNVGADIVGPGSAFFSIESIFGLESARIGSFSGENTLHNPGSAVDGSGVSASGEIESPFQVAQVPEPGTLLLMGASLLGLGIYRRKTN
jgi:hypothetical protein